MEKKKRNIILLGPNGAGKTSFINYLYLYFQNCDIFNIPELLIDNNYYEGVAAINTEKKSKKNNKLHTHFPQYYELKPKFLNSKINDYYLNILDTPGFCERDRDLNLDEYYQRLITQAIENGSNDKKIDAILIFIDSSDLPKKDYFVKYFCCKMKNYIPDSFLSNVILCITNSKYDVEGTTDFIELLFDNKFKSDNLFKFDNSIFSQNPKEIKNNKKVTKSYESMGEQVEAIFTHIAGFKPVILEPLLNSSQLKETIMQNIFDMYYNASTSKFFENEIDKIIVKLSEKNNKSNQLNFQELLVENGIKSLDYININRVESYTYNAICLLCHKVCHKDCTMPETRVVGDDLFDGCSAFNYKEAYLHENTTLLPTKKLFGVTYEQIIENNENCRNKVDKLCYVCFCSKSTHIHNNSDFKYDIIFTTKFVTKELDRLENKEIISKINKTLESQKEYFTMKENLIKKRIIETEAKIIQIIEFFSIFKEIEYALNYMKEQIIKVDDNIKKEILRQFICIYNKLLEKTE